MTTLLEASRLALEALEKLSDAADGFSVSGVYFNEEHWAKECLNKSYDAITSLRQAIEQAHNEANERSEVEPVAWIRRHPNGALSNEVLIHVQVEPVRRESGAWVPLYTSPPQRQPEQEPVAWNDENVIAYCLKRGIEAAKHVAPQRQPLWIDPNDKTQERFLPNIGEPVLFCHGGKTYYGRHTGGSFQYGAGVTKREFNTWDCRWMYLPAAHGIKGEA